SGRGAAGRDRPGGRGHRRARPVRPHADPGGCDHGAAWRTLLPVALRAAREPSGGERVSSVSAAALHARAVRFSHGRVPLFEGLDLTVRPGELVSLLGRNGSGKTTLLRLLSGSLRPQSGELLLEGRPLASMPPRERARRVAVVPQDLALAFDYTVMEM